MDFGIFCQLGGALLWNVSDLDWWWCSDEKQCRFDGFRALDFSLHAFFDGFAVGLGADLLAIGLAIGFALGFGFGGGTTRA